MDALVLLVIVVLTILGVPALESTAVPVTVVGSRPRRSRVGGRPDWQQ